MVLEAALNSATQNTNATSYDYTWAAPSANSISQVTLTAGSSLITFESQGHFIVNGEIVVTDGQANNRQTWALYVDHQASDGSSYREYLLASASYIRDDAGGYDSGACAGEITILPFALNDMIIFRSKRLDAQSTGGNNYANQTQSRVQIRKVTY